MNERATPKTPSLQDLRREELGEEVTLLPEQEMRARLLEILPDEEAVEKFYPSLLKYAGQTILISQVPGIIVDALREYVQENDLNLRHYASKNVPLIIDAVISDPIARKKANDFLNSSING